MKDKINLPCDFLDKCDTERVSLLRDYGQSQSVNHTEFLIARQLMLQDMYDRLASTVDRFLKSPNGCLVILYPRGSLVGIAANCEPDLFPEV